ncbi:MAG: OmpA family protein [Leptonema sp. (in: bacteria)]
MKKEGCIWIPLFKPKAVLYIFILTNLYSQNISKIYYYSNTLRDTVIVNQLRINSQWDEYSPTPILGEKYLVFQSQRPGLYEEHSLWYSFNKNYRDPLLKPLWSNPLPLTFPLEPTKPTKTMEILSQGQFTVNSNSFTGHPTFVIQEGKILEIYFTSHSSLEKEGYENLNIYYSQFKNGRWSKPEHIPEINSNFDDLMPYITLDGKKLFFVSNRPGGYGGFDIWYSERDLTINKWAKPVNLGPTINTEYDEITPFLTKNGQKLIFSSNRPQGMGQFDLYISYFNGLEFDFPLNLGEPFNSPQNDESLKISDYDLWAYFASDRLTIDNKGGYDIYRFQIPKELIESIKILLEGKILDAKTQLPLGVEATIQIDLGLQTKVFKSDRRFRNDKKTIENNFKVELFTGRVYRFKITAPGYHPLETIIDYKTFLPEKEKDERIFYLEPIKDIEPIERYIPGVIVDEETNLPLPGSKIIKIDQANQILELKIDEFAQFSVPVRKKEAFSLQATSPGYESKNLNFKESDDLKNIIIKLKKIKEPCLEKQLECIWNTKIFFDLDSSVIKPKEAKKIELIAEILKLYPEAKIEIQGHTDQSYRGPKERSYEYNLKLSIERAKNVKEKLKELGIAEERLMIRGYSFTKPLIPVPDPIKGAINRRVEFMEFK